MTRLRVAAAPISWGICEVPGWGVQLDRDTVIRQMSELGFAATELGPAGFLPTETDDLQAVLAHGGLALAGSFVAAVLHDSSQRSAAIAEVEMCASLLAEIGLDAPLVLACATGLEGYESREVLDEAGWSVLAEGVAQVAARCASLGVTCVLHPHVGTMIETASEVDRIMAMTDVDLCLDTGHLLAAGADSLAVLTAHTSRVQHVHLKDVVASIAEQVRAGHMTYADAVSAGMYVPLGTGDVPLNDVLDVLDRIGYSGWIVVEQDVRLSEVVGAAQHVRSQAELARSFFADRDATRGSEVAS